MMHHPAAAQSELLPGAADTIVASATAPGRGAVALIRLSGARAIAIVRALGVGALDVRRATRARLRDPVSGAVLDDALVTWFAAPRSYTGEELVELGVHGGTIGPERVIAACIALGARPAWPGEFTRRAVLNGKMDLLQAEAIADLVDARTTAMQQQALAQLDGGLSRRLLALRDALIHLEALLAYDVDFPEEDDGPIPRARIAATSNEVEEALAALVATAPRAAMRRDGVLVVLAGPPNAGKSSLFNALLGHARAIVTPVPGTTRDAIEALLDRTPWPLRLVDTAGVRETADAIEQLGIEVSTRYLREAQVVLVCGETGNDLRATAAFVAVHTTVPMLAVRTKADLMTDDDGPPDLSTMPFVAVSAESGAGLDTLLDAIDRCVSADEPTTGEDARITRERHRVGLATALNEVRAFRRAWGADGIPAPIAASHLLVARDALSELLGTVDTEEILGRVFRDFCIGK